MHLPERWGYIQFAGQKTTLFKMPDSEFLKYYLWSVYYKQADYIRNNGRYAERAEELGLNSNPKCGPFRCKVSIYSNPFQFFAVLQAEDSNEAWQIDQQGQIQRFVANKNQ